MTTEVKEWKPDESLTQLDEVFPGQRRRSSHAQVRGHSKRVQEPWQQVV